MGNGADNDGEARPRVRPMFFVALALALLMALPFWGGIVWLVHEWRAINGPPPTALSQSRPDQPNGSN